MISRDDFVFTVGYEGSTAVVDGASKKRYRTLSTLELAEKGLFKQAVRSAVYSGPEKNEQELEEVLEVYNRANESSLGSVEELKRIFGVFEVPEGIGKVMVL